MMEYITEDGRIYANDENGKVIAEITFPVKDEIATIDHTYVDDSLRGQGIAGQLIQMVIDKIMADGHKLAATCSYATVWLQRHPEIQVENRDAPIACKIDGKH
jgi:predicted GNAT family acetyltransferase